MGRLAALPMYDPPERQAAQDQFWAAIAARLRAAGLSDVPDALTRPADFDRVWRDPDLLLGQTCGFPLMAGLRDRVRLVATPVYRAAGCEGAWHRSAIVVRQGDDAAILQDLRGRRCVINGDDSNSGMNLLRVMVAPFARTGRFFGSVAISGSHRRSLAMVATGLADVAAIDGVTLALMTRIDPALAAALRILSWSPLSPGLPMITAADDATRDLLRGALNEVAADPSLSTVRDALLIERFEVLPLDQYAAITDFADHAAHLGYPELG